MKYSLKDLENLENMNDNDASWWIRQLSKDELALIADNLSMKINKREKKATFLERILAVTDFSAFNDNGETPFTAREYTEVMHAAIQANRSPVGIIVYHTENDWTRRLDAVICTDTFPGMVNVGARIIAVKA